MPKRSSARAAGGKSSDKSRGFMVRNRRRLLGTPGGDVNNSVAFENGVNLRHHVVGQLWNDFERLHVFMHL